MNAKQLKILLFVVGFLIAISVLKVLRRAKPEVPTETQALSLRASADAADRITIAKGTQPPAVELRKADGRWTIPSLWDARADAEAVRRLLDTLATLSGEPRGQSAEVFSDFGITDDEALHLAVFEGATETAHALIGTAGAAWQELFLRAATSSTVFLVRSDLLFQLGMFGGVNDATPKAEPWLDLRLFPPVDSDAVQTIEIKEGTADWRAPPFEGDPAKMNAHLQGLSSIRASSVVDPKGAGYGFDAPAWELRLTMKDTPPMALTVGALIPDSTTDRYAKRSDLPQVYTVSKAALEQLTPTPDAPSPAPSAPQAPPAAPPAPAPPPVEESTPSR